MNNTSQPMSSKQFNYIQSLIGKSFINNKVQTKEELWDKMDLLPDVDLKTLDGKYASQIIKSLLTIQED
ncbi:hypothetical protein [Staphylococcus phage vB_SsapH-Golestan-100]|nr:hypothetical protein [Staphylococcus phage vB_SsapH-Golestan-100]